MTTHPKGDFDLSRAVWQRAEGDTSEAAVEVAFVDDLIGMRNSAEPDGPVLVFTQAEWDAFVAGAQDGEFDLD
ncbi:MULTISPECIES: DUF397 domain-containing protein [Micromonosporaceae]|uniref:DUF397 domain-containing protein n=6 Tax=Micromonosporaceae TaxID=28056 RepID=A4XAF8_SALTO|nr:MULTISPECIES: DUF397 domain-containing protein [Micromonosporaceae]ABP55907.1 protein of unknown function DUF397 [Salinispora tropica CNB-440]AEB46766.1 hypothetical protein VAB18032_28476 [Micromonospora maris AB-18-032]KUJ47246.1 hypothetical protein ADL17_23420 [Micromonospora maris]MBL6276042.1 DUF397 domain-containing protein [Micromonospora fiedleri]PMR59436.1 DUF397 domain-containing protein [Verrucosispora sp. ts21]